VENAAPSLRLPGLARLFPDLSCHPLAQAQRSPGTRRCAGTVHAKPALRRETIPRRFPLETAMLHWALMFLVVALVAAIFGFGGIASAATGIAQVLFVIAIVLFLVSLLAGFMRRNS
jgi:uncharacterized membrane protein YtjA (UPF0391 family)